MRCRRLTRFALVTSCVLALVGVADLAHAAPPSAPGDPASSAPATTGTAAAPGAPTTAVEKAKLHYDRGIQLYSEENFEAAQTEFERAYELQPNFKILYSLALIQRHQNNYAAAMTNFRRYLAEGGTTLSTERRTEVEKEIALLKPRCATVEIKSNVDGADVFVDDVPACQASPISECVGKTPIVGSITVNPGRRRITASKAGYTTARSIVNLVGSDAINVRLDLTSLTPQEKPVDYGPRNYAIIGWSVTGALAITAAITGVLALNGASTLKKDRDSINANRDTLASEGSSVKTLALVSDIFTAAAIIGGGVSVYLTSKALGTNSGAPAASKQSASAVRLGVGPTGAGVFGRF